MRSRMIALSTVAVTALAMFLVTGPPSAAQGSIPGATAGPASATSG
jgi:hypothetical protein